MFYGYAHVSRTAPDMQAQVLALKAAGCDEIIEVGPDSSGGEYTQLVHMLRQGDRLAVTRLDRLATSVTELMNDLQTLERLGVSLLVLEQHIDTAQPSGQALLRTIGLFADFEATVRRERQLEGIEKAKAAGAYTGRKSSIDPDYATELFRKGLPTAELVWRLGLSRAHVYRLRKKLAPETFNRKNVRPANSTS